MYLISLTKANYSHTTSTNKSALQRNHICDIYSLKIAWFSTNKSVYETEH